MTDPHEVTRRFESAISEYTGAPYVVTTNSCSMALLLAMAWYKRSGGQYVTIPRKTYPSVPMGARHAGLRVEWSGDWEGVYNLHPSAIWDCAKRFTSAMYVKGQVQCVSFHIHKNLKIGQGGAILHDDPEADAWYRKARFDGRTEGVPTNEDEYTFAAYHCYMSPDDAARGLWLLSSYPDHVEDQPMHDYPDLSKAVL